MSSPAWQSIAKMKIKAINSGISFHPGTDKKFLWLIITGEFKFDVWQKSLEIDAGENGNFEIKTFVNALEELTNQLRKPPCASG